MKQKINFNNTDKTIEESFDDFMIYNRAKNLSDATMFYYRKKLERFTDWLINEQGIEKTNKINSTISQRYIIYLQTNYNLNSKSINTHLRAVKVFKNYLVRMGYTEQFRIELLKTQDKVKPTYTEEEINLLLEKPDLEFFGEYRTWVVVNWLLATGNRLGTLINIKIKDLDFNNEMLLLNKNKNKRAFIIPMARSLVSVLQEYLEYRNGEPEDYLFCTIYGEQMEKSAMVSAVKRYHKNRGITSYSIHKYRHTFAKLAIMNGIDPLRLQKILGHSTLDMTRKYVNLFGTDLKKGFNKYNPLENFKSSSEFISMKDR